MERETGVEPAAPTLARLCSTTELLPHKKKVLILSGWNYSYFFVKCKEFLKIFQFFLSCYNLDNIYKLKGFL